MMSPLGLTAVALLVVQIGLAESINQWNCGCGLPNLGPSSLGLSLCGPKTTCCTTLPNDCGFCTEKKVCITPKLPSIVYLPLPLNIARQLLASGFSCGPVIPSCCNRGQFIPAACGCGKTTTCTTLPTPCGKTTTTCTTVPHDNPVLSKTTMCTTMPLATCDPCDACSCGFQLPCLAGVCKPTCGKQCIDWSC